MKKDDISLIRELNKETVKLSEFDKALQESGYELPDEELEDSGMDDEEFGDEEAIDDEGEMEYNGEDESGLDDDELQEIVDWCEEECADMSDDELKDTLTDELGELDLEPDVLDDTISRVMDMLGRGSEEEMSDEYDEEPSEFEGPPEEGDLEDEDEYEEDYEY